MLCIFGSENIDFQENEVLNLMLGGQIWCWTMQNPCLEVFSCGKLELAHYGVIIKCIHLSKYWMLIPCDTYHQHPQLKILDAYPLWYLSPASTTQNIGCSSIMIPITSIHNSKYWMVIHYDTYHQHPPLKILDAHPLWHPSLVSTTQNIGCPSIIPLWPIKMGKTKKKFYILFSK